MNLVVLIGRLGKDPIIHNGETKVAKYTLAVDRIGEGTDWINCVAFGKGADFAEKHLRKGIKIAVNGRIQTGSYTKEDGTKIYTTEVAVSRQEFVEKKQEAEEYPEDLFA